MDNIAITSAQKLHNWADGQQAESLFDLLRGIGIDCNFTSISSGEWLIHEAMDAKELAASWRESMREPAPEDAEAFIRHFLRELDDTVDLTWPPMIGRTDMNRPARAVENSLSTRSDHTNYWELHLCTGGETIYSDGTRQHLVSRGTLVLIPPGVRCSYLRTPNTMVWQHYWCQFDTQQAWQPWCVLLQETRELTTLKLDDGDTQRITDLAQTFIDYNYPDEPQWFNRAVYCRIEALLLELCAAQSCPPPPMDERIHNALHYIQQHFCEDWSVTELASHCHLSVGRLSVLFKQQLGSSPMSFRDSLRMAEACDLLLNTRKSIGGIGEKLGYPDQMHFSRRFSHLIGTSPREYRNSRL